MYQSIMQATVPSTLMSLSVDLFFPIENNGDNHKESNEHAQA